MRFLHWLAALVLLVSGCANKSPFIEDVDAALDAGPRVDSGKDSSASDAPISDASDAGSQSAFMVLRVGKPDGAALTNASTAGSLEERRASDGMLLRTINLPTAADGGNAPLTFSGAATAEGSLSTSGDGKYVVVAGYGAAPGVAGIATTTATNYKRVIGRIDFAGAIDTTTKLTAFSGQAHRCATSNDGTAFWTVGGNTGVLYATLGAATATTISTTSLNNRAILIAGGQLYGSTQAGAYRIFAVGSGLPTMAGQVASNLAGVTGNSPQGFALADLTMVTGVDTLYVADERAPPLGGVQRWTSNGTTWMLATTFNAQLMAGCSNVLAMKVGAQAQVICSTLEAPTRLVRYVDDGTMSPPAVVLATGTTGMVYRGLTVSPQ